MTKGDNYVGAAEPELREKIAALYGEVASYAGKPSGAQLANLSLLNKKLTEAKTKVEVSVKKSEDLNKVLEKAKITKKIMARPGTGAQKILRDFKSHFKKNMIKKPCLKKVWLFFLQ